MKIDRTSAVRALAVLFVAFAAGHLVQSLSARPAPAPADDEMSELPRDIQLLAAEVEDSSAAKLLVIVADATALTAPPVLAQTEPLLQLAELTPTEELPAAPLAAAPAAPECKLTLDLTAEPDAMIGAALLAPCHPGERVVIRHAGLAVTGQTTATGSLLMGLPALEAAATVEVKFGNGEHVSATVALPDFAGLRRFGVQWQADRDEFQLQAFEGGASYGDPGHRNADSTGVAPIGQHPADAGYVSLLGDAKTALPMLAEIYTFPRKSSLGAEVVIEAPVTAMTCGHEMLGETLSSTVGRVTVTELTLAMPECDAVGDFLVLKNLAPDMTLAAAD
jgi:hypothetical protein